jgi:hypothetical protein
VINLINMIKSFVTQISEDFVAAVNNLAGVNKNILRISEADAESASR